MSQNKLLIAISIIFFSSNLFSATPPSLKEIATKNALKAAMENGYLEVDLIDNQPQNIQKPIFISQPFLTGILTSSNLSIAKITYQGVSSKYILGDNVPPFYRLSSIKNDSIILACIIKTINCKSSKTFYLTTAEKHEAKEAIFTTHIIEPIGKIISKHRR